LAREISERIGDELDYRTEAAYQQQFADFYRGHPFIRIPEVVPELSTGRVLTMDFVDGLRFAAAREAGTELRDQWGEAIYRFTIGSMRQLLLFNADPHPGNYLFHPDGTVSFLDFGCVKRFTPNQMVLLQETVNATIAQDAPRTRAAMIAAGVFSAEDPPDAQEMLEWFSASLAPLIEPQPYTYTPEYASGLLQAEWSPSGRFNGVLRKLSTDPDYLFLTRIDLGMTSVLAALGSTAMWASIQREWDAGALPVTPMGKLEHGYRTEASHAAH
jgi:hypothetical protein